MITTNLDALYSNTGRSSSAPELLLKRQLLIARYWIRSDRRFYEELNYNSRIGLLLDVALEQAGLDHSNFSRLLERLVASDIAGRFFDRLMNVAWSEKLLSADNLTVDCTPVEA